MNKKNILFFLLSLAGICLSAQEIEVKKGIILVDGKECLKIDKRDLNNISIADLSGNDLVYLKYADDRFGKRYNTIVFVTTKSSLYTQQFIYTGKSLVKRLIENHVLENCQFNDAKVENFIAKYGENVQLK